MRRAVSVIAVMLALAACADDDRSLSACRKNATPYNGVDVYCCSFCEDPVTKQMVFGVDVTGRCVAFCDGCIAEGFAPVQQCPGRDLGPADSGAADSDAKAASDASDDAADDDAQSSADAGADTLIDWQNPYDAFFLPSADPNCPFAEMCTISQRDAGISASCCSGPPYHPCCPPSCATMPVWLCYRGTSLCVHFSDTCAPPGWK